MALTPGSHLGPYEIVAPLGAGGMGEVYRAKDAKLNREVAIKVLPATVGRWIAFASDVSRNPEIYIRPLEGNGAAIRISNDGRYQPRWRNDGRELFYVDAGGRVVAVPITPGEPPKPGAPVPLFQASLEEATDRQYDVAADGQRFLLNRSSTRDAAKITVILDWRARLDRKAN